MGKPALEQTSKHKSKNDVKKEIGMYRVAGGGMGVMSCLDPDSALLSSLKFLVLLLF